MSWQFRICCHTGKLVVNKLTSEASMESQTWQLLGYVLTALIAITGIALPTLRERRKLLIDVLRDPTDRLLWIDQLSTSEPLGKRYSHALTRLNSYVSRLYSTPLSIQAYDRSLVFTLVYPFALYLLAWGFGASNKIGGLVFMGSHANGTERLVVVFLYFFLAGFAAFLISAIPHSERLFLFDKKPVLRKFSLQEWLKLCVLISLFLLTWWLNQNLTSVGYAISFSVFFLLSISLYLAWRSLFSSQRPAAPILTAILILGILITFAAVKVMGIGAGSLAFLVLFFVMLPLTNALFDYLSWAVTRWFLRLVARKPETKGRVIEIVFGLVVDTGWAALCLFALALAIVGAYSLHAIIFPDQSVDWRSQLDALKEVGSPTSVLIIGMLVTTLIPTFIHVVVGISGVFIAYHPNASSVAGLLSKSNPSTGDFQEASISIQRIQIGVGLLVLLLVAVLIAMMSVVGSFLTGYFHTGLKALLGA